MVPASRPKGARGPRSLRSRNGSPNSHRRRRSDPVAVASKIQSAVGISFRRSPIEKPYRTCLAMMEVEPPSPVRYLIGAAIMMAGVVLPVGYMMFRNKRAPSASSSSSSYSKQTSKVLI
ncbi:hypothetical protein EUGRSUZ_E00411 [Eucalyptus grandis]|uniref:Uncharacterized protein n=2 Tax=Eucalyptus grandis TaxID=71139 RepID=A0ACC3KRH9_EUCGR|nr:hypothetical protein EUGRSUZ_E00411 [Eucalyptus grandis]